MRKTIVLLIILLTLTGCKEETTFSESCQIKPDKTTIEVNKAKELYEEFKKLSLEKTSNAPSECLGIIDFNIDGVNTKISVLDEKTIHYNGEYYNYSGSDFYNKFKEIIPTK